MICRNFDDDYERTRRFSLFDDLPSLFRLCEESKSRLFIKREKNRLEYAGDLDQFLSGYVNFE